MTKVRQPLHSDGAVGKMDDETIFSSRHGKTYRKRYAAPTQPNTKRQKETRKTFAWTLKYWQKELTKEEREAWRAFARRDKGVDRFTMTPSKPPAHSVFIRAASICKRAGFPPPRKPPRGPSPAFLRFQLSPKGKGIQITWEPRKGGAVEFRWAVTQPWVNPWETLFRVLAYVPADKGEYLVSPLKSGKKYTFLARILASDGQAGKATAGEISL